MKTNTDIEVIVKETSRATFTSSKFESTVNGLLAGGWEIDDEQLYALEEGAAVTLFSINRKITISKK